MFDVFSLRRNIVRGNAVAGAILAAALLLPAAHRDTSAAFGPPIKHGRINVYRNPDGTVKLGTRNEAQSTNWSGYVLSNFQSGQTYSSGSASWTVPTATYQAPTVTTCHKTTHHNWQSQTSCFNQDLDAEYSASWVGIGGSCEDANCDTSDSTLIQLGTEQDAASDGSTQYYAWYELLPADSIEITSAATSNNPFCHHCGGAPLPVQPGDSMSASLTCQSNCEPGKSQTWLLSMSDKTQNWTWSTTVTYKSTLASVEWIQEAPTGNAGVLPLSDYGKVTFDPTDDGANPGIANAANGTVGPDAIEMVDTYGETSQPSPVASLDVFSTCWGNNPNSIAACPAP
jgi:hypothetical protein